MFNQEEEEEEDNDDDDEDDETVSIDICIIEIVLEGVEEIGIGEFVVGGDNAISEDLKRIGVVYIHRHRRNLLIHICVRAQCSHHLLWRATNWGAEATT